MGALLGPIFAPEQPDYLADQARALAGAGFDSLWTAQAVGRGFMLTDPLTTLTVAATVTDDVELGTAILQLSLYNPMDVAYRLFSLAQIAGPRLQIGVGAGSTEADFVALEQDFGGRFGRFRRDVDRLRDVLATGAEGDKNLAPWPNTLGSIPLLYGTWGNGVAKAATEFDGWIASGMHRSPDEVLEALVGYREAGGSRALVSTIQISGETDLGEQRATFERYAEAGIDDVIVMLLPGAPDLESVRRLVS